jgi:hypothetical protein
MEGFMTKNRSNGGIGFFGIFALVLIFSGFLFLQGQVQTKGKPPGVGKPPQTTCDNNGNCEYEELDTKTSLEDQPCPDCRPETYGPLLIEQNSSQIASRGRSNFDPRESGPGKVYLYKYTGNADTGGYEVVWDSVEINNTGHNVCIGDVDNDGFKEIAALNLIETVTGKGKNKETFYSHELLIFEEGDLREPTSWLSLEGETVCVPSDGMWIADVDNDGQSEIIVLKSGQDAGLFEVYQITQTIVDGQKTHSLSRLYADTCEIYSGGGIWGLEVGDADNDSENEIVLSRYHTTRPFILEFNGSGWTAVDDAYIEPTGPDEAAPFFDDGTLNFNVIKVSDVDGDGDNELVAGGNSGWLMIWKFDGMHYIKVFSQCVNPDNFTWALDAGDVDGDTLNEIVIGLGSGGLITDAIRVYEYNGSTYEELALQLQESAPSIGLDQVRLGDLDGGGVAEIVTEQYGLTIYRLDAAQSELVQVYNFALGYDFDIN